MFLLYCVFVLFVLFGIFWCLVFFFVLCVRVKSYCEKNDKKFKTIFWYFLVPCNLFKLLLRVKTYHEKTNNRKFKTVLITSFILLLNMSYHKALLFLIIINFFNYHNFFNNPSLFQLSWSFSIIKIFCNLFTTCDTIFVKKTQSINSII